MIRNILLDKFGGQERFVSYIYLLTDDDLDENAW